METIAKLAIGAAVIGGGLWLMSGTASASPTAATASGDSDGCADGTSDGKAGYPSSYPSGSTASAVTDSSILGRAKASGNQDAYLSAYLSAYDRCWNSSFVAPSGGGGGGGGGGTSKTPITPPPGVKPGTTTVSKDVLSSAYAAGCKQGALDGYAAGFAGDPSSYHLGGAAASGNSEAYTAAYRQGYGAGYSQGSKDSDAGMDDPGAVRTSAGSILASGSIVIRTLGINLGCAGGFDEWLALYVSTHPTVKVAGSAGAGEVASRGTNCPGGCSTEIGFMGLQRLRAPGRVSVRGPAMSSTQRTRVYAPTRGTP